MRIGGIGVNNNSLSNGFNVKNISKNKSRLFSPRNGSLSKNVKGLILESLSLVELIKILNISQEGRQLVESFFRNKFETEFTKDVIKNYLKEQYIDVGIKYDIDKKKLDIINYYSIPCHIVLEKFNPETLTEVLNNIKNIKSIDFTKLTNENLPNLNIPIFQRWNSNIDNQGSESSTSSYTLGTQSPNTNIDNQESELPNTRTDITKFQFCNISDENVDEIISDKNVDLIMDLLNQKISETEDSITLIVGNNKVIIDCVLRKLSSYPITENFNPSQTLNKIYTDTRTYAPAQFTDIFSNLLDYAGRLRDTITFVFYELENGEATGKLIKFKHDINDEKIINHFFDTAAKNSYIYNSSDEDSDYDSDYDSDSIEFRHKLNTYRSICHGDYPLKYEILLPKFEK